MATQEQHTAGAQILGFEYQLYYFMLLALELKSGERIGFEVKDDIHIEKDNGKTILFQAKHTIHENQNLTELDADLWKTLSVWAGFIKGNGGNFLDNHSFVLVTNKNAENNEFINTFSSQNIDIILSKLNGLKDKTSSRTIKEYIKNILSLGKSNIKQFIPKLAVITVDDIIIKIKDKILEKTYQCSFVEPIFESLHSNIRQAQYFDTRNNKKFEFTCEDFSKRFGKCFRIAFEKQQLPKRNYPLLDFDNLENQIFIKQLLDIGDINKNKDVQLIRDYTTQMLNALKNFSDWMDIGIILPTDIDDFERNNITMWKNEFRSKYRKLNEKIDGGTSIIELESEIKDLANELVNYLRRQDLSIQGFQPLGFDLSNGHFYVLSDALKIGWHYDWENKYKKK